MKIESPEDVLRLMAEDMTKRGRSLSPGDRVDLPALLGLPISQDVQHHIRAAENYGWIEKTKGECWQFTRDGIEKFMAVEEEAGLGRFEGFLRREHRVRPLTWGIVVPILSLLFSLAALAISIITA